MRLKPFTVAFLLAANSSVWASDEVLNRADALIRLQAPQQAYELLAPLEEEQAGNPDFDYLLGLALLESGNPQNAIFAFERCLATDPKNGQCRVQMARTHLALGEADNARAELETVQSYSPPEDVQQIINQYLGTVATLEKQQKRRVSAYAVVGVGFDSNINGAPEDANKVAAALPKIGAPVNPNSIPTSDDSAFANLNAGGSLAYQLSPEIIGLADIAVQSRSFFSNNSFDYQSVDTSIGANFNLDTFQLLSKLQGQTMWLDGTSYRNIVGGLLQAQTDIANGQAAIFRQHNKLSYSSQSVRDAKRNTTGLAYSRAFDAPLSPSFYISTYTGEEDLNNANTRYLSNRFNGLRLGSSLRLTETLSTTLQLSQEKREYNKDLYPLINVHRADTEKNVNLNANWRINKHFSVIPSYTYTNNQSNIAFSDYTRHVFSVDLRFDM